MSEFVFYYVVLCKIVGCGTRILIIAVWTDPCFLVENKPF